VTLHTRSALLHNGAQRQKLFVRQTYNETLHTIHRITEPPPLVLLLLLLPLLVLLRRPSGVRQSRPACA
jgi:hypothetical protein